MAATAVRSGKHGYVGVTGGAAYHQVRNWILAESNTPQDRVSSATRGGHTREYGVSDFAGSFDGFGATPPVFPGDKVSIDLFTGPTTGVFGAAGLKYNGAAIIDSLSITWDWRSGGDMSWSASFSANGCLSRATDADLVETPAECMTRMCPIVLQYADYCAEDEYAAWPNVQTATLTLTSDNPAYINSSTNCCTKREPGNFDWMLDVTDDDAGEILTKGTYYTFRLFTTSLLFWELNWGLYHTFDNLNVDVQTGAIKSKTNRISMAGQICCDGTTFETGSVIDPATTTKWPIAAA